MKLSQLRQIIKEEIRGVLNENLSYDELAAQLENSDNIILGDEKDMVQLLVQLTSHAGTDTAAKAVLDQINDYLIANGEIIIDGVDCTDDYWGIVYTNIESNTGEDAADIAIKILKTLVMFPEEAKEILKQQEYTQSKLTRILNIADLTEELDAHIKETAAPIFKEIEAEKAQKRDNNMGRLGAPLSEIKRRHSR